MIAATKIKVERSKEFSSTRSFSRILGACTLAVLLSGCASISIPFASLSTDDEPQDLQPLHTASIDATATTAPDQQDLPPELSAAMPMPDMPEVVRESAERPTEALIASLPQPDTRRVSLTQADLNAMSSALTHVLATDAEVGTFAWSHEATGRSGLMTPFRATQENENGRCRVVSVEITDGGRDTILLGDACLQNDRWVFVTPRAGELL